MLLYKSENFADLYVDSLSDLVNSPQYKTSPRGFEIKENTNVCLVLNNPLSCLFKSPIRSSQKKYISAELLWYFFGSNDIEFINGVTASQPYIRIQTYKPQILPEYTKPNYLDILYPLNRLR